MSDAYESGGHLTVQRPVNGATNLVEVWELEHLIWYDENVGSYDVVKCHIARANHVPAAGVPHTDDRVSESCSFDEVPAGVQQEFIEQAERLLEGLYELEDVYDE